MPNFLVFAPDALVRFRAGQILIHTTSSPLPPLVSESPMMIGWLCQFARPTDLDALLARLSAADREAIAPALDHLRRAGSLVDAATAPSADDRQAMARSSHLLRSLARSIYDLSCDANAFGIHAERELQSRSGLGLEQRLLALLNAVDGLKSELGKFRDDYVEGQLQRLGVDPLASGHKLHIGCGPGHLPGWVNIDIAPAPLSMNVLWGLPFADGSVSRVFVSHLFEHLFFPVDARAFLAEVHRVLMPGGVVRLVVPDVEQCIEAYVNKDPAFFGSRRETWDWWPENPTRLEDFLAYAGVGPDPGYLFESHKFGYDFETLSQLLGDSGFSAISRCEYMQSAHADLRVDDVSSVAKARYGDRYYSLFVEARR